jgi:hypothetical protein
MATYSNISTFWQKTQSNYQILFNQISSNQFDHPLMPLRLILKIQMTLSFPFMVRMVPYFVQSKISISSRP